MSWWGLQPTTTYVLVSCHHHLETMMLLTPPYGQYAYYAVAHQIMVATLKHNMRIQCLWRVIFHSHGSKWPSFTKMNLIHIIQQGKEWGGTVYDQTRFRNINWPGMLWQVLIIRWTCLPNPPTPKTKCLHQNNKTVIRIEYLCLMYSSHLWRCSELQYSETFGHGNSYLSPTM